MVLTVLVSLLHSAASTAWSQSDDAIREKLKSLASDEREVRQQTLAELADSPVRETVTTSGNRPIEPDSEVIDSASPLKSGAIWRLAGQTTEQVARRLKDRLEFLKPTLGESPWGRKW